MSVASATVAGDVVPGFEPVRDAFATTLGARDEAGGAFAVVRDGRLVVDLWGGLADTAIGAPWQRDTLSVIFSGTKGLVALCLLLLIDRGLLDLDAPVAQYWPEFAVGGKDRIRVVDVASHRASLPSVRTRLSEDDIPDDKRLAALLAAQEPDSDPRAAASYHALTYGWLCGELVRRVDGRSVGTFFAEEVAQPLGLALWIGLPPELLPRVAKLACAPSWREHSRWDDAAFARDELASGIWNNPPLFAGRELPWNRPDWQCAEIPGGGAIGTSRSVARLYACLACGGTLDGVTLLSEETLALGRAVRADRIDPLLGRRHRFGVGFQLQTDVLPFGPSPAAFGHTGAGGSVHCAWPDVRAGLSYSMNELRNDPAGDPRVPALLAATAAALAA